MTLLFPAEKSAGLWLMKSGESWIPDAIRPGFSVSVLKVGYPQAAMQPKNHQEDELTLVTNYDGVLAPSGGSTN
jgi:hypothetical protein